MKKNVFNAIVKAKITEERRQKREKRMADFGIRTHEQENLILMARMAGKMAERRHTRGYSVLRAGLFRLHAKKFRKDEPESNRGYLRMKARMIGDSEAARIRAEHGHMTRAEARKFLRS